MRRPDALHNADDRQSSLVDTGKCAPNAESVLPRTLQTRPVTAPRSANSVKWHGLTWRDSISENGSGLTYGRLDIEIVVTQLTA
jgi:hypothetical protein